MTLAPGLYKWSTGVTIPSDVTLSGSAGDVWVFQIAQNLNLSSATKIVLSGGAQAGNIFWVVAGQTTIGTTALFNGKILDQTAIVLNTGAKLNGRALAQTAVTLDANAVAIPSGSVSATPAIPAIPAVPTVNPAVPAIPAVGAASTKPSITITSPNGGNWQLGQTNNITWSWNGVNPVGENGLISNYNVYLVPAGNKVTTGQLRIGTASASDKSFTWTIPESLHSAFIGQPVQIWLESKVNEAYSPILTITATTPNGNQIICTMEAFLCSDGSYVSRHAPSCAFTACPVIAAQSGTQALTLHQRQQYNLFISAGASPSSALNAVKQIPTFISTPAPSAFGQQVRSVAINLGKGSRGNDVMILQQFLISENK